MAPIGPCVVGGEHGAFGPPNRVVCRKRLLRNYIDRGFEPALQHQVGQSVEIHHVCPTHQDEHRTGDEGGFRTTGDVQPP